MEHFDAALCNLNFWVLGITSAISGVIAGAVLLILL